MPKQSSDDLTRRQREICDFLAGHHVAVLATVDTEGKPHAAVVYYALEERFVLTFITRTDTKKYHNLMHDKHTMAIVYDAAAQQTAQITGKAVAIKDNTRINDVALQVFRTTLSDKEHGDLPITKLEGGGYAAFRIEPDQIRLATYARPDSGHRQEIFESIESFDLYCPGNADI